jgi:DNA-binding HxlR family transcriptional regulator
MDTKAKFTTMYAGQCPSREALDRIGDKWASLIIGLLEDGTMRFSDLKRAIGGITQKMLTQTLRNLERDGLVKRTVYPQVPPRVEYELTELGATLIEPLAVLRDWAQQNITRVTAAQQEFDAHKLN